MNIHSSLIRLAHRNPELRSDLLSILKEAADLSTSPVGKVFTSEAAGHAMWFIPSAPTKSGTYRGVFVSWPLEKRGPDKAKQSSLPERDLESSRWKIAPTSDVPPEVKARFADSGTKLASTKEPPMKTLRSSLIRLAHANPELRPHLLPILKEATALTPGVVVNTWPQLEALSPGDRITINGRPVVVIKFDDFDTTLIYVDEGKATRKILDARYAIAEEPGESPETRIKWVGKGKPLLRTVSPRRRFTPPVYD